MLNSRTLREQYEVTKKDDFKILIIGAGIAGITAAQMLRKDGRHPVLIERRSGNTHPGYMLALMPMVDAVLEDLEVSADYRARSVALGRYGFYGHRGKRIRVDSMESILNRYGDYRGISRGELLDVLTLDGCAVSFDTVVTAIHSLNGGTEVQFSSEGAKEGFSFDLVVIADGMHSRTREMVLDPRNIHTVDTRWGGWVVWAPEDAQMDLGEELWGTGFFYGVYPVKGHLGVFLGGNLKDTAVGPDKFVQTVREKLKVISPRMESCLQAVTQAEAPFFWPLTDCRCPQWAFGNRVLIGDAAAGFLPTAGIGAGMAMESAWVLTRMLRYATKANAAILLKAFEEAQRPRVEAAQGTSRSLARIMFHHSRMLALFRDLLMRFVSVEVALKPIQRLVANRPDPDEIARKALQKS